MSITPEEKQLNAAIALAADVHRNQVRKEPDGRPYICHVLDVVNAIPKDKHRERLVAALHDTIEDVDPDKLDWLLNTITEQFGDEVLDGVIAMTHDKKEGFDEAEELTDYLKYIEEEVLGDPAAPAVKIADNYVNMKDRVGQFIAGGPEAEDARKKLHQYARSIALLTAKKR
jgi:guanosine-3',5'-bis(diphosphate) 3'-pyrophosphohydrolase